MVRQRNAEMATEIDMMPKVNEIMATPISEIDKLAQAYHYLMSQYIGIARHEQELQQALGDKDALVKLQVQSSTLEYALGMFKECYHRATGRNMPNELS
jgi:hypothetical protein